jgi:hypothetical protein
MPKYEVTFKVEYVIEVEAEDTAAAALAARAGLGAEDLGGPWRIDQIIRTDPPLSLGARSDAGLDVEQPGVGGAPELPPMQPPVDCSTYTGLPVGK